MKKKLNLFCVLMLVLMVAHVTLSFVQGADDFARGWEEGAANNSTLTWSEFLFGIMCGVCESQLSACSWVCLGFQFFP